MPVVMARSWWAIILRGLAAILAGIIGLVHPGLTLAALIVLFAAYAFTDGVLNLVAAARGHADEPRWLLVIEGLVSLAVCAFTLLWPGATLLFLIVLLAVWALVTGVLEVAAAVRFRRHLRHDWFLALAGIASILWGILLLFAPITGAVVLAWWLSGYLVVFGALLIGLGLRGHHHVRTEQPPGPSALEPTTTPL